MKDVNKKIVKVLKVMVVAVWSLGLVCHAAQPKQKKTTRKVVTAERNQFHRQQIRIVPLYCYLASSPKSVIDLDELARAKFFIPPQVTKNFWKAWDYIQSSLQREDFKQYLKENLITFAGAIYKILVEQCKDEFLKPYREKNTFIWIEDHTGDESALMQKYFSSETDRVVAAHFFEKCRTRNAISTESAKPTVKEEQVLGKVGYIPPSPEEIPNEMKTLGREWNHKIDSKEDPQKLACWLHQEILRIYPYPTLNERLARIMMNIVRMLFGHIPVTCEGYQEYVQAVRAGGKDLKIFERYVEEQVPKMYEQYGAQIALLCKEEEMKQMIDAFMSMIKSKQQLPTKKKVKLKKSKKKKSRKKGGHTKYRDRLRARVKKNKEDGNKAKRTNNFKISGKIQKVVSEESKRQRPEDLDALMSKIEPSLKDQLSKIELLPEDRLIVVGPSPEDQCSALESLRQVLEIQMSKLRVLIKTAKMTYE